MTKCVVYAGPSLWIVAWWMFEGYDVRISRQDAGQGAFQVMSKELWANRNASIASVQKSNKEILGIYLVHLI